jgi:hypothetical protein
MISFSIYNSFAVKGKSFGRPGGREVGCRQHSPVLLALFLSIRSGHEAEKAYQSPAPGQQDDQEPVIVDHPQVKPFQKNKKSCGGGK